MRAIPCKHCGHNKGEHRVGGRVTQKQIRRGAREGECMLYIDQQYPKGWVDGTPESQARIRQCNCPGFEACT